MPASVTPAILTQWMAPFQALFTRPTWQNLLVLVAGSILAPGRRTVTSALSIMGLREKTTFTNFHRVLNRNRWSGRACARRLLTLLITAVVPSGPVVIGIDETIERRWGAKIKARGIYRDPVRSSHGHFVKASGLRWISVMLLAPIPWAGRVWALPFLTALAPSERFARERGCRHKKLTDWARQLLLQTARWLPERRLVAVGDMSYAAIELLTALRRHLTIVTRLRLDARLFDPPPPRKPGQRGRPRVSGARQPSLTERLHCSETVWQRVAVTNWYGGSDRLIDIASGTAVWDHPGKRVPIRWVLVRDGAGEFEPQALLCTDLAADPDPGLVCAALVRRGDVGRSAAPPRRRDTAPVVGRGDRPYDARPHGPVLARDTLGRRDARRRCSTAGVLVPQVSSHLQRRARERAPHAVALSHFRDLAAEPGPHRNPETRPQPPRPGRMLPSLKRPKSS